MRESNGSRNQILEEILLSPGRKRSLKRSKAEDLLSSYNSNIRQTRRKEQQQKQKIDWIVQLFFTTTTTFIQQFQEKFTFGRQMELWRKGRSKKVMVFIDQDQPNMIWTTTFSKSFLFDLVHTTISRCDYNLQKQSGATKYLILHYFDEDLPFIFRGQQQKHAQSYYELFQAYIKYQKLQNPHPASLSKMMKLYTTEDVKDNISRKKTFQDILNITLLLNLGTNQQNHAILRNYYKEKYNKTIKKDTDLNNQEMTQFFKIVHCNSSFKSVFQKYASVKLQRFNQYLQPIMTLKAFGVFLDQQQGESQESIVRILKTIGKNLSFYDFCAFLEDQTVNHAAHMDEVDDSLPLTDYFCYSSHNTYLTGNQLTSDSKIQRYIEDLQRGIKCVQLDVHNDGGTPIITHAFRDSSLCKPIDFQETIKQIGKYCDNHPDHYPIILSIENRAKQQNRYKMANIFNKYLGSRLFYVFYENSETKPTVYKTLGQLKGKVIVKTDSFVSDLMAFFKEMPGKNRIKSQTKLPVHTPLFASSSFQESYQAFNDTIRRQQKRKEAFNVSIPDSLFLPISQLSKLTGMFKSPEGVQNDASAGYECTSLSHQKALKKPYQKMLEYTNRSWLRIYPKATQICSGNFDPVPWLGVGAQIIALNTQTKDDYARMLMSYFTSIKTVLTHRLGYIPKAEYLRAGHKKLPLEVVYKIYTIPDNQVQVALFGSQEDVKMNKNSKRGEFVVRDNDEAFLVFKTSQGLKDCLPLRFVRRGYRVLKMTNQTFRDSGVRVMVCIDIKRRPY